MNWLMVSLIFVCLIMTQTVATAAEGRPQKVLIVYYSSSGNTKVVAEKLQKKTAGDMHRLETVRTYPAGHKALVDEAKRELEENDLPELKGTLPDLSSYDLILVGGPVWWYTVSTPVMHFLQQADFAGKKVAAFCTHGGGVGHYFPHFKEQARNAVVLEGLSLWGNKAGDASTDKALDDWLATLW